MEYHHFSNPDFRTLPTASRPEVKKTRNIKTVERVVYNDVENIRKGEYPFKTDIADFHHPPVEIKVVPDPRK